MLTQQEKKRNFERAIEKHIVSITNHVVKLSNLKNRSYYDYTEADIKQAFSKIRTTIDQVEYVLER